jgi:hypothetical protein
MSDCCECNHYRADSQGPTQPAALGTYIPNRRGSPKRSAHFCSLSKVKTLVPLDWSTDICVSMYGCQQKYLILIKVSKCDTTGIQCLPISHFKSFERHHAGLSYTVLFSVGCRCAPAPFVPLAGSENDRMGTHKPIDLREGNCQGKYLYLSNVYLSDTLGRTQRSWTSLGLHFGAEAISVERRPSAPISVC